MKATVSFVTLALGAAVLAEEWDPLPKRDVATIQNVIMMASTALETLDTTVKAFNGQDFNKLAGDAQNLKTVLMSSTQQVMGTSPITAQEAITLQSSLTPVQTAGMNLVSDLKSKKSQFEQASLCTMVQQQATDIGSAASALLAATVMKVPAELQSVATQLTSSFTSQLTDAGLEFSPGNCTDAAGGSASLAGITMSNSTSSSSSSSTPKSGAATYGASAFGVLAVAAAGIMML